MKEQYKALCDSYQKLGYHVLPLKDFLRTRSALSALKDYNDISLLQSYELYTICAMLPSWIEPTLEILKKAIDIDNLALAKGILYLRYLQKSSRKIVFRLFICAYCTSKNTQKNGRSFY